MEGGQMISVSSRVGGAILSLLLTASVVQSADLYVDTSYCALASSSELISIPENSKLESEVIRLMDESVAVADSSEWVNSSRPAFVWASEAKVACGKAYGYLQSSYRDEEYINKCECFHERMVQYMN
jgi:hypothetical protein